MLFRLRKFYLLVLKFPNSVLCHFHSTIDPIQWGFVSTILFLSFIISLFQENLKLIVEAYLCSVLEMLVT